jgi:hypothetical protein
MTYHDERLLPGRGLEMVWVAKAVLFNMHEKCTIYSVKILKVPILYICVFV